MVKFIESFIGYSSGELDGQGSWHRNTGAFNVHEDYYCYNPTTDISEYYNSAVDFKIPDRLYYKAICRVASNGIIEGGVNRIPYMDVEAGFRLEVGSGYIVLYKITNGSADPYLTYAPYWSDDITIEFIHNYVTHKFEWFSCDHPSYYGANLSGSSSSLPVDRTIIFARNVAQSRFSYLEVDNFVSVFPKYLKYPKWQKTRYGMRPWY